MMQRFLSILMFVSFAVNPLAAHAAPSASADYDEAVKKISQVRDALKISAASSAACDTPNSPGCTFQSYCSQFSNKAQDFYLYQDEQGHQIPNFQMQLYVSTAEACLRKPFPQAAVNDPFVYPEQLINAQEAGGPKQYQQNKARYEKELARTKGIFDDVQARIIKVLQDRRNSSNATEIDNMISRVKTVQFKTAKLGDGVYTKSADGCEMPNAYYEPSKHTVTVCPQFLNMPDATLFSTLSHELGHSIDPCSMAFSYASTKQGMEMNFPEFMGGRSSKDKPTISAIAYNKNPLGKVLSCLQSPSSIGANVPTKESLLSKIDQDEDALREEAQADAVDSPPGEAGDVKPGELGDATLAGFEDERKTIRENYDNFKGCPSFTNSGHLAESWSDWLASQTLAGKLSEIQDTKKAQQYAFASQGVFFSIGCTNVGQASYNKAKAAANGQCPHLDEIEHVLENADAESGESSHPVTANRANRIFYAQPQIQKALGCKASTENNGSECK